MAAQNFLFSKSIVTSQKLQREKTNDHKKKQTNTERLMIATRTPEKLKLKHKK